MGDLDVDTRFTRTGESSFEATLSPDWEIWGPNGGYLAAVALRAAGAQSGRARPASINAHFLGAGTSTLSQIEVQVNRATRVATSATVTMSQDGRPILLATVWGIDADLPGIEHHTASVPLDAGNPADLPNVAELMAGVEVPAPYPFWANLESRPLRWIMDWENRVTTEREKQCWYRFVPTATFDDPWVDAGRTLVLIDVDSWPSASLAHTGTLEPYAPTIELNARFIGSAAGEEWLLGRATSPVARAGLVGAVGEVWTEDHRLVAVGGSTLLCRPAARLPRR